MRSVYLYSIRNPRRVVAIAVLVTLAVAPGVTQLRLRTDGNALLPTGAPEIAVDKAIRDAFGVRDQVAVVIQADGPDGVFTLPTLDLVREWTRRFGDIEGIGPENVISLATEKSDRVFPGTLRNRGFLDPPLETREQLETIRNDLKRIRLYTGTILSFDDTATAILIGVPGGMDRTQLYNQIQGIITEHGPVPEKVCIVGAPVAESLLGTHILEDLGVPGALLGHRVDEGEAAWRWPRSFYDFRLLVGRHVGLVPIAVAIMAVVFLVSFRSLVATMLPLGEVGACLMFVLGAMGWCGVPIYLTIAVLPVILTAIGIADEIHIFSRYRQHLRERTTTDHVASVVATMDEMWRPVVKTSITTAIGFMSFVLSPIAPVRAFGIFTALGILFCMLWSLTVIPACLAWVSPRRILRDVSSPGGPSRTERGSLLRSLTLGVLRFRFVVLGIAVLAMVVAPWGVRRVVVQDSWIDGFAPDSAFYKATQLVNRLFHGTHILLICVDTGHDEITGHVSSSEVDHFRATLPVSGPVSMEELSGKWLRLCTPEFPKGPTTSAPYRASRLPRLARIRRVVREGDALLVNTERKDGSIKPPLPRDWVVELDYDISPRRLLGPAAIRTISALEHFVEKHRDEAVGGVIGTADYISTVNYMTGGRKEERRCVPDDPQHIRWLWQQYDRVRGTHRLREILDVNHARGLITVFMENANYVSTQRLMDDIRDYERTHLAPRGIALTFAGDVAVSQTLIDAIVTTQVRSLLLSLVGILAVTTLMGRSLGWGICCVLPCGLAVLVNFAVMGVLGIPLGVATSMFSAMTLGIGVDFAIHFTERFRHATARGMVPVEAVVDAVKATGPAVILDALAIALGFGVMMLSQVPSNARLGGLVVLSVIGCLFATLLVLPCLLTLWQPAALRRSRST